MPEPRLLHAIAFGSPLVQYPGVSSYTVQADKHAVWWLVGFFDNAPGNRVIGFRPVLRA